MSFWTPEKTEQASALCVLGQSAAAIAQEIGASSRNAVISKLSKLGLHCGAVPDHWSKEDADTLKALHAAGKDDKEIAANLGRTVIAIGRKRARLGLENPSQRPIVPSKPLPIFKPVAAEPKRVPLISAGYGECRYPLWPDADPLFHVCGLPSGAGSYCEHHARLCWAGKVKNAPRARKAA